MNRTERPRPNPAQWLWYIYGGRLDRRYREWVRHDVTCRTWWLRHVLRTLLRGLPAVAVLILVFSLLHGPVWIGLLAIALGVLVSVYYSVSYVVESCDSRLARYGYPAGYASAVRAERTSAERATDRERYAAAWRT